MNHEKNKELIPLEKKLCFSFHLTNLRDITAVSATGLSELGWMYGVDVVRMLGVMYGVDVVRMLGVMYGVDVVRMFSKWSSQKNVALPVQLLLLLPFQSQDICRSCTACILCAYFSKLSIEVQYRPVVIVVALLGSTDRWSAISFSWMSSFLNKVSIL